MNDATGGWIVRGAPDASDLRPLLDYARDHYRGHIDWFLKHKEEGVRTLTMVLTAEFAIVGVFFTSRFDRWVAIAAMALVTFLAVPITRLAILSCKKSYTASLEHAVLVTKVLWAMGLTDKIKVAECADGQCPVWVDESVFPTRYLDDARRFDRTESFVEHNLKNRNTTLHATRQTLFIMGTAAVVVGLGAILAMALVVRPGG